MLDTLSKKWFYFCTALYAVILGIGFYYYVPYVVLIPVAILFFWAAFYKLENVLFFVVMFTPFSVNLEEMEVAGETAIEENQADIQLDDDGQITLF